MAASARKKVSSASSDTVMSIGVPNTVVVLMKDSGPSGVASRKETITPPWASGAATSGVAWVLASAGLLLSGRVDPTTLGLAFVIGQAVAVAALAEMQYVGLVHRS